ncbi:MAG: cation-translocating P-type ATPase [Cytophagales bacterium]|nr:cation-translocating P-type ATPase [Cytophagales bacterium]
MYQYSVKEIEEKFQTNIQSGLTDKIVQERLEQYGHNSIKEEKEKSILSILVEQFKSPIVFLLIFAAAMSFFFKEWLDGIAILVVLLINAVIGFFMEFQAQRSMKALKKLAVTLSKVVRNGRLQEVPSENLVPGDILFLEAGDMISADSRVIKPMNLQSEESSLTGESLPVEKTDVVLSENTPLAERVNMLYKSTFVTKGNSYAIVTSTGMNTELGKIAKMVQSADQEATPIEKKLEAFSKKLIWITVILVVIIFIAGVLNGQHILAMLQTSIALAVAAIPEGLPIVATLALAYGMLKLAKQNVIVKKLASVETLGGTTIICTDKTGTLTQNIIEVTTIVTSEGKDLILVKDGDEGIFSKKNNQELLNAFVLCNTASITNLKGEEKEVGDPLEIGLLKAISKRNISFDELRLKYPKIHEEPFSSETKIMATLHKKDNGAVVYAKGAVEELLKMCTKILIDGKDQLLDEPLKTEWIQKSIQYSSSGLRVLAFGYKETTPDNKNLISDLVFTGLAGMVDPERPEVASAILECKNAGIRVVMITGDHPTTAKNIGLKLGLIDSESEEVIHGNDMKDFEQLPDTDKERWRTAKIFARVSPKQKLDLVKVLQEGNTVVAMTGDGVNDAPALKKADIGIAMGKRGTQVAQEVADMILKDDSFTSIVSGIKQGRIIFDNIRKFVIFLLSCNLSEIFVIAVASIFNLHFQLFPLQILFINIVTDVLPALALGVSEGNTNIMQHKPRSGDEPIINTVHWMAIFIYSGVIMLCSFAAVSFSHYTVHKTETFDPLLCNNILFYTIIFSQLLHVFNMSDRKTSFLKNEVFRNKYVWYAILICLFITIGSYLIIPVRSALDLYEITIGDWIIISVFSLASLLIIQALKKLNLVI